MSRGARSVGLVNAMFNAMIVDVDDSVDPATFQLSGGISSSCLGGAATTSTQQALTVRDDEVCPRAGALTATSGGRTVHIFYRANQNVEVDVDGDNVVDRRPIRAVRIRGYISVWCDAGRGVASNLAAKH